MSNILAGLKGVLVEIDDVLIFGKDQKEHDQALATALQRIKEAGVTLNASKCVFNKKKLKFLGHVINTEGIQADPDKTSAITGMKEPTNVSELRRFLGMVNHLGKFSSKLADLNQPLRQLLSAKSSWTLGHAQDKAFAEVKQELVRPTILALYNPKAMTKVSADASS